MQLCRASTEFHFDEISEQIRNIRNSHSTNPLKQGDFFVTKHSNLADIQVVFHLIVDSPNSTSIDVLLTQNSSILVGLKNILQIAAQFDVENLTIPLFLLSESEILAPESQNVVSRAEVVLQSIKNFLTQRQTEELKTITLAISSSKATSAKVTPALIKKISQVIHNTFSVIYC